MLCTLSLSLSLSVCGAEAPPHAEKTTSNTRPPPHKKTTQRADLSPEQQKVLRVLERTFSVHILESDAARAMKERLNTLEAELAERRNAMDLSYVDEAGATVPGSSVVLRNVS